MKINKIASLILIFMLSGCSSRNAPTATPVMRPSIQSITASPSPAPTFTPIPLATKYREADLPEDCINLAPTSLDASKMEGLLVIRNWADILDTEYLFDPQAWQKIDVVNGGQKSFAAYTSSPNKENMLASISMNDGESYYVLKTPNKVSKINVPIPDNWIFSWWSDNEQMVFYTLEPQEYVNSWNPFTGELKRIKLDLPNAIDEYFAPNLNIVHAYIDPSFERVFYGGKDGRLILWDLKTKKVIASLPKPEHVEGSSAETFWPFGAWSPEANKLITPWPIWFGDMKPPANELYVFDRDGNLNQLTDLNQKHPFANADDPIWSPDGRQIGFWLKIGAGNSDPMNLHQWLAVFDNDTKETTIYCLANDYPKTHAWPIVWSPSSQQLIVNNHEQNVKFSPILIDLVNQTQSPLNLPDMGVLEPDLLVEDWIVR